MCNLHHGSHATQSVYNMYMTANGCVHNSLGLSRIWQQGSNCGLGIMCVCVCVCVCVPSDYIRAFEIQYVV